MESIRDSIVSDSLWGVEEKKHSLRQLFPKAISKLLVDVHTCNSSGSVPWLRLVLLQRSIGVSYLFFGFKFISTYLIVCVWCVGLLNEGAYPALL